MQAQARDDNLSFGRWVRHCRKALDQTQAELARGIGYSESTIRRIEADDLRPSRQMAERLAAHFDLPLEERAAFLRLGRSLTSATPLLLSPTIPSTPAGAQAPRSRAVRLPEPVTPLIGREAEVRAVRELLLREDVRLVTLTGPGGVGKTRLAVHVAREVRDFFPDGVFFVNLAPLSAPDLVPAAIVHSLQLQHPAAQSPVDRLKEYLADRTILLALDNFEQVADASALVAEWLAEAAGLRVLVTSRTSLHLRAEHNYAVPPLALPPSAKDEPRTSHDVTNLTQYASVRLFVDRAQAVWYDFHLTPDNAATVGAICHQLDGLPLAIELAAAHIRLTPPAEMLRRLGQRLTFLVSDYRDLPARQQTLRNTLAWSYDLLSQEEKTLFRRLAVLVGGFTLEAALDVAGFATEDGRPVTKALDLLRALVDKSLVRQVESEHEPRFTMLETIREYAVEQLLADGEMEAVGRRHAHFFLALAEEAVPHLSGGQQTLWLARLEREHANLRAALNWFSQMDASEWGLRLAIALGGFWEIRSHWLEGRQTLEVLLERSTEVAPQLRLNALRLAARFAERAGDLEDAQLLAEAHFHLSQELGDARETAWSLLRLGHLAAWRKDFVASRTFCDESLGLFRALGDTGGIAASLLHVGQTLARQEQHHLGLSHMEQAVALWRQRGDRHGVALGLMNMGGEARHLGEPERAEAFFQEALSLVLELGDTRRVARCLEMLGRLAHEAGHEEKAAQLCREGLARFWDVGAKTAIADCLQLFAILSATWGDFRSAVRLVAAVENTLIITGYRLSDFEQRALERTLEGARAQLSEAEFTAAWVEGGTMSTQAAVTYALGIRPTAEPRQAVR